MYEGVLISPTRAATTAEKRPDIKRSDASDHATKAEEFSRALDDAASDSRTEHVDDPARDVSAPASELRDDAVSADSEGEMTESKDAAKDHESAQIAASVPSEANTAAPIIPISAQAKGSTEEPAGEPSAISVRPASATAHAMDAPGFAISEQAKGSTEEPAEEPSAISVRPASATAHAMDAPGFAISEQAKKVDLPAAAAGAPQTVRTAESSTATPATVGSEKVAVQPQALGQTASAQAATLSAANRVSATSSHDGATNASVSAENGESTVDNSGTTPGDSKQGLGSHSEGPDGLVAQPSRGSRLDAVLRPVADFRDEMTAVETTGEAASITTDDANAATGTQPEPAEVTSGETTIRGEAVVTAANPTSSATMTTSASATAATAAVQVTESSATSSSASKTAEPAGPNIPFDLRTLDAAKVSVGRLVAQMMSNGRGVSQATLMLEPADLGRVQVRLETLGNVIQAVLTVQDDAAQRAMQTSLPALEQALRAQGFGDVKLSLNLAGNDSTWAGMASEGGDRGNETLPGEEGDGSRRLHTTSASHAEGAVAGSTGAIRNAPDGSRSLNMVA